MQLIYRGAKYQTQPLPNLNLSTSEVTSKYRGTTSKISPCLQIFPKSLAMFTYRGIGYSKAMKSDRSNQIKNSSQFDNTKNIS